jgi:hypothetical protein
VKTEINKNARNKANTPKSPEGDLKTSLLLEIWRGKKIAGLQFERFIYLTLNLM